MTPTDKRKCIWEPVNSELSVCKVCGRDWLEFVNPEPGCLGVSPTDNKAPMEWELYNEQSGQYYCETFINGPKLPEHTHITLVEKSYADKLKLRLEKCEALLRGVLHNDNYYQKILEYFAEVEGE